MRALLPAAIKTSRVVVSVPFVAWCVLIYLGAITIVGKGPTYLAIPPLYWSEITLILSVCWLIHRRGLIRAALPRFDLLTTLVILFMGLGCIRMLFSFSTGFRLEVLRDSAIWYYGCFYFVGVYLARQQALGERIWRVLVCFWVAALIWGTADILSGSQISRLGPMIPGRGEPFIHNSVNELVQHMALGAMIVINPELHRGRLRRWVYVLTPLALVALGAIAISRGRGAKIGIAIALFTVLLLRLAPGKRLRMPRQILAGFLGIGLLGAVGFLSMGNQFLTYSKLDRFVEADPSAPKGTAHWRMLWWQRIAAAVREENPLFGLGFGESLNIYNPYLEGDENTKWPVRSPHNVNITVFSRMGWVGAGLWLLLLVTLMVRLIRSAWRGHWHGQPYDPFRREELAFWIAMILATWGNSSFGVLMEGPVLGVWFWFAAGFAGGRAVLPISKPVARVALRTMSHGPLEMCTNG